jgi:hypothetical protein
LRAIRDTSVVNRKEDTGRRKVLYARDTNFSLFFSYFFLTAKPAYMGPSLQQVIMHAYNSNTRITITCWKFFFF